MEENKPVAPPAPATGPIKPFKGRYNILNDPNTAPARIYVGNLSELIDENALKIRFGNYGQVTDVLLKKGFAFIQFMSKDSAAEAIEKENKTTFLDKVIAVKTAVKKGNEPTQTATGNPNAGNFSKGPPQNKKPPSQMQQQQQPMIFFNHTVSSNHIEIMAMSKDFTKYAENIENYLKDKHLKVDILYPNPDVPMQKILENIQSRGTLFALEIDEKNVQDETVTVYILYTEKIKWQRDMRVKDALEYVQKSSEEYVQPSSGATPLSANATASNSSFSNDIPMTAVPIKDTNKPKFQPYGNQSSMKHLEEQVADLVKRERMTLADLDNFIENCRKMRAAKALLENPLNPEPEPEIDPAEERIQKIVKSENYLESLMKPEPFVMTKERLALLQDPKIERALDTLLHPDIFSTLELSFIKNM